jgi:hypothetical protein
MAFMISCKEATQLVAKSQETSLTLSEKVHLMMHMAYCRLCKAFLKQMTFLQRATTTVIQNNSSEISEEALARIEARLHAEDGFRRR